jgi:hypothetical protein
MAKIKLIIPGPVKLIIDKKFIRMDSGDIADVPEPHATRLVESGQFELVGAPAVKNTKAPENKKAEPAPVKTEKQKTSKGRK